MIHPSFADKTTSQHYAFSYVEFMAHVLIVHGGKRIPLFDEYAHTFYFLDRWKDAYEKATAKTEDRKWAGLAQLLTDVQQRRVATLTQFYEAFKALKHPKRGEALADAKARKARKAATRDAKGEDFIDNPALFQRLYQHAASSAYSGLTPLEIREGRTEIIAAHSGEQLSETQMQGLHDRFDKRIAVLEQQVTSVVAELLRYRTKDGKPSPVAARALWLYQIICSECAVDDTIIKTHSQWAALTPYSKNSIGEAMDLLKELGAIELLAEGVGRIPKGSSKQRQSDHWKRLR